jgi:hypothetical protein
MKVTDKIAVVLSIKGCLCDVPKYLLLFILEKEDNSNMLAYIILFVYHNGYNRSKYNHCICGNSSRPSHRHSAEDRESRVVYGMK